MLRLTQIMYQVSQKFFVPGTMGGTTPFFDTKCSIFFIFYSGSLYIVVPRQPDIEYFMTRGTTQSIHLNIQTQVENPQKIILKKKQKQTVYSFNFHFFPAYIYIYIYIYK